MVLILWSEHIVRIQCTRWAHQFTSTEKYSKLSHTHTHPHMCTDWANKREKEIEIQLGTIKHSSGNTKSWNSRVEPELIECKRWAIWVLSRICNAHIYLIVKSQHGCAMWMRTTRAQFSFGSVPSSFTPFIDDSVLLLLVLCVSTFVGRCVASNISIEYGPNKCTTHIQHKRIR